MDRDYFNFGTNRSCDTGWKPLAQYGVAQNDIPPMATWNCYGSVIHAYSNSGTGYSTTVDPAISGRTLIRTLTKAANDTFSSSNIGSILRGDVIVYEWGGIIHAQTVTGGTSTYAANNEPLPESGLPTWKWATCSAGEYANICYRDYEVIIKVYR